MPDVQDRGGRGRRTGGDGQRAAAAFQRGDPVFQDFVGGVDDAGVAVDGFLGRADRPGMGEILEYEGGGLIDRRRPRPCSRVGRPAYLTRLSEWRLFAENAGSFLRRGIPASARSGHSRSPANGSFGATAPVAGCY